MKKIKKTIKNILLKICSLCVRVICFVLPLNRNIIIFNSYYGQKYDDSPANIADAIHTINNKILLYWSTNNKNIAIPNYVKVVLRKSLKEKFIFSRAKVIVSNVRTWFPTKIKKNQIYIQTWHGSFALKLIEGQIENKLDRKYVDKAKYDGSVCTAILSSNSLDNALYKEAFWLNSKCEILKYGLPRNDFIINNSNNNKIKRDIRKKIGLGYDDFVILFAPTFRNTMSANNLKLDYYSILRCFEAKTKKRCKLLIRVHSSEQHLVNELKFDNSILDGTNNLEMQELSLICDVLITDYSSTVHDYLILGKPIFLYLPDFDSYIEERGLSRNFYDNPFAKAYDFKELLELIDSVSIDNLSKISSTIYNSIESYENGNASQNVAKWILIKINKL